MLQNMQPYERVNFIIRIFDFVIDSDDEYIDRLIPKGVFKNVY